MKRLGAARHLGIFDSDEASLVVAERDTDDGNIYSCGIPLDAAGVWAKVDGNEAPLLGGPSLLWPTGARSSPERTFVASDRMARIDVERS